MPKPLSDLVTTLDTSRRLHAAGVPGYTALVWFKAKDLGRGAVLEPYVGPFGLEEPECPAWTLEELLAWLPPVIHVLPVNGPAPRHGSFYLHLCPSVTHSETVHWVASYRDAWWNPQFLRPGKGVAERFADTRIEAVASLLLLLLESGLLSFPETETEAQPQ